MKLTHLLLAIIVCLTFLLWQSMEDVKAKAAETIAEPTFTGVASWVDANGKAMNRMTSSWTHLGSELILAGPGDAGFWECRQTVYYSSMQATCSDLRNPYFWNVPIASWVDHPNGKGLGLQLVYGQEPYRGNWASHWAVDKLCFAPKEGGQHSNWYDTCLERTDGPWGQADVKISSGDKYVYLSELVALVGR